MVKRLHWPIVLSLLLDRISGSFASYMVHRIFSSGSHCQANTNIGDTRGKIALLTKGCGEFDHLVILLPDELPSE